MIFYKTKYEASPFSEKPSFFKCKICKEKGDTVDFEERKKVYIFFIPVYKSKPIDCAHCKVCNKSYRDIK